MPYMPVGPVSAEPERKALLNAQLDGINRNLQANSLSGPLAALGTVAVKAKQEREKDRMMQSLIDRGTSGMVKLAQANGIQETEWVAPTMEFSKGDPTLALSMMEKQIASRAKQAKALADKKLTMEDYRQKYPDVNFEEIFKEITSKNTVDLVGLKNKLLEVGVNISDMAPISDNLVSKNDITASNARSVRLASAADRVNAGAKSFEPTRVVDVFDKGVELKTSLDKLDPEVVKEAVGGVSNVIASVTAERGNNAGQPGLANTLGSYFSRYVNRKVMTETVNRLGKEKAGQVSELMSAINDFVIKFVFANSGKQVTDAEREAFRDLAGMSANLGSEPARRVLGSFINRTLATVARQGDAFLTQQIMDPDGKGLTSVKNFGAFDETMNSRLTEISGYVDQYKGMPGFNIKYDYSSENSNFAEDEDVEVW